MTKRRLETDLAEQQKARTAPARHLVALTLAWSIAAWSVAASSTIAIFAFTISPVQADEKKAAEGKPGQAGDAPEGKEMVDNGGYMDKWYTAASNLDSYSLTYKMTVYRKSKQVTETGKLWYKKPGLLKIEEVSGPNSGAVAILGKDGKVKAHPGGMFKAITVNLNPDSHYLKCANGWPMVQSDYVSLAKACQQYVKEGVSCKVSSSPSEIHGRQALVMEMHKDGKIYKRALFDPTTTLPFEWWDYTDGQLFAHSTWSEFHTQELADNTFTMKGKGEG